MEVVKKQGFRLLRGKVKDGQCPVCAAVHDPGMPHNQQSLFYQYSFYEEHGRWPTWADALEHCSDDVKERWAAELKKRGIEV